MNCEASKRNSKGSVRRGQKHPTSLSQRRSEIPGTWMNSRVMRRMLDVMRRLLKRMVSWFTLFHGAVVRSAL